MALPNSCSGSKSDILVFSQPKSSASLSNLLSQKLPEPDSISDESCPFLQFVGAQFDEAEDNTGTSPGGGRGASTSDHAGDEDLSLEQCANSFLLKDFGISLERLPRPYHAVYAIGDMVQMSRHKVSRSEAVWPRRRQGEDDDVVRAIWSELYFLQRATSIQYC
ncbi:hypothetical protein F5Y16DRAFT_153452 [Xylariaceae sp. FL0255]|nr:hypothetical protein F5Y16DRAFT_153452 [Xylariaceae sp. FL0255]